MKKIISFVLLCSVSLLSSCASIVNGTTDNLVINSNQSDTEVLVKNKAGNTVYNGVAPTTLELKRSAGFFQGENYTVESKKAGYTSQTTNVATKISGWYIGNILFGGLIGLLIVDPATGAMYNLNPDNVMVNFATPVKE